MSFLSRLSPIQRQSETVELIEVMENDEIRNIRMIRDTENDRVCSMVKPSTGGNIAPCPANLSCNVPNPYLN